MGEETKWPGKNIFILAAVLAVIGLGIAYTGTGVDSSEELTAEETVELPDIDHEGVVETIYYRDSVRSFTDEPLCSEDAAHLLWAGEGISVDGVSGPTRTSPSAGATNPLEIFLVAGNMEEMSEGVYNYDVEEHELKQVKDEDLREDIAIAALGQEFMAEAPAIMVIAADYERTTGRYGERGIQYVHMESGHAAQNMNLVAEERGLGAVFVGAFEDEEVQNIMGTEQAEPLLLIPVGVER